MNGAATCSEDLFHLGVPVLGLCYGAQLMTHVLGGKVERAAVREYGKTEVKVDRSSKLFSDVSENTICWMSHFDYISKLAPGFPCRSYHCKLPCGSSRVRRARTVCDPVPPGSTPHGGRLQDAV